MLPPKLVSIALSFATSLEYLKDDVNVDATATDTPQLLCLIDALVRCC
jgi:hypothetical protein